MSWRHYLFGFSGRINRAKMWASYLILLALEIPIVVVGMVLGPGRLNEIAHAPPWSTAGTAAALFYGLISIVFFWFMLAVIVKRFHDRNKSAWWLLFFLIVPVTVFTAIWQSGAVSKDGTVPPSAVPAFGLAVLVLMANNLWYLAELFVLKGTAGPNRFGPDPLQQKSGAAWTSPD